MIVKIFSFLRDKLGADLHTKSYLRFLEAAIQEKPEKTYAEEVLITDTTMDDILSFKTLSVKDPHDLDTVIQQIEAEKKIAVQAGYRYLMLKIISDSPGHRLPRLSGEISFGIGFPTEENKSQKISLDNLSKMVQKMRNISSFTYVDEVFFAENTLLRFDLSKQEENQAANEDLSPSPVIGNILEYIEIRYLGDGIGFGVFAKRTIPEGVVLGNYSGILGLPETRRGYDLTDSMLPCLINPEYFGNWAHLVNHAFMETEPHVWSANIAEKWRGSPDGYPNPELTSVKEIPERTQLFFDYEQAYWNWVSRRECLSHFIKNDQNTIINKQTGEEVSCQISKKSQAILNKYCCPMPMPSSQGHFSKPKKEEEGVFLQSSVSSPQP